MTEANHGIWKTQPDGPDVWRRSVYVYRKRGLAFPMFQVFDLPEQNVTSAARYVSTVPTQALTLLNDAFVLRQAQLFADRVKKEAGERSGQADRSRVPDCADPAAEPDGTGDRAGRDARRIARRLHPRAVERERVRLRRYTVAVRRTT